MNWNDLNFENSYYYNPMSCYLQSKLANILFTVELDERLKGKFIETKSLIS